MTITQSIRARTSLRGLRGLEACIERDAIIYVVRSLYRLIFQSHRRRENQQQLQQRIGYFEQESNLPRFLSAIPIAQLLIELEDAQFRYPISRRDVTLPTFD